MSGCVTLLKQLKSSLKKRSPVPQTPINAVEGGTGHSKL